MRYRLILSPEAFDELDHYIEYLAVDQTSPQSATMWLDKAFNALRTLTFFPNRCPPAPESRHSRHTIRMLIVDRGLFLYRVDEATKTVRVLRFRHGRQEPRRIE